MVAGWNAAQDLADTPSKLIDAMLVETPGAGQFAGRGGEASGGVCSSRLGEGPAAGAEAAGGGVVAF